MTDTIDVEALLSEAASPAESAAQIESSIPRSSVDRRQILDALAQSERGVEVLVELARRTSEALALETIDALASSNEGSAALALSQLAESHMTKTVRKAAARALHRLRSRGVVTAVSRQRHEGAPPTIELRLSQAFVSSIDGVGARALRLSAEKMLGGLDTLTLIADDTVGIRRAVRRDQGRRAFQQESADLPRSGPIVWAEVPPEYGYWLAEQARSLNVQSGEPVPPDVLLWRRAIGQPEIHYERPLIYEEISAADVRLNPGLLEASPELLEHETFQGWYLEPETVRSWTVEYLGLGPIALALSDAAQAERQERTLTQAIEALFNEGQTRRYRRRLEEMALVLKRIGQDRPARLALAVALDLPLEGSPAPSRNPFIRAFVLKSFTIAQQEFRISPATPIGGHQTPQVQGPRKVGGLYLP